LANHQGVQWIVIVTNFIY